MSLATKYRPKTFNDVTEQSVVTEILQSICENNSTDMACRNFLLTGPAGCGKAQPLTSNILTPNGYIKMGEIQIGDEVYTENGDITEVSDIYPQGEKQVYRIHFTNGDFIDVSDEHLNVFYEYDEDTEEYERVEYETSYILENYDFGNLHYLTLPVTKVEFEHKDIDIDPYLLGVLFASSNMEDNIYVGTVNNIAKIFTKNYWLSEPISHHLFNLNIKFIDRITENKQDKLTFVLSDEFTESMMKFYCIDDVNKLCDALKTVPDIIKFNDSKVRHQFVEGALSSFDTIRLLSTGTLRFDCDIRNNDFAFVVESLGYVYSRIGSTNEIYLSHPYDGDCDWYDYFESSYFLNYASPYARKVAHIEELDTVECQCILVDDDSHTYISECMVQTHNTTCARIMSNILNDGIGEPIEVDAASNGNIEAMRDLVKEAQQYPVGQKYKVFIVDEAHSISTQAWQTALKILEEAPAKTIWIFCTTNPEKIPDTIISRVQTFQLSKISLDGINDRLIYVLESEKKEGRDITYEKDAVNYIAKMANGGMRDALTLLDKALAYSNVISIDTITNALNIPEYDDYFNLLSAYAKHDNNTIASIVDTVYNSGVNFIKWFESFHSFVVNIIKFIFLQDINMTMIPSTYQNRIANYSEKHTIICLSLANRLIKMNQDLRTTPYLQEIALTYLCTAQKSK